MIKKKVNNIGDYEKSDLLRNLAIGVAILIVFFSLPSFCTGDCGHAHDHMHADDPHHVHHHHHDDLIEEPASFKWSKAANEGLDSAEDHSASHEHGHHHHPHAQDHTHHHHHSDENKHEQSAQKNKTVQGENNVS